LVVRATRIAPLGKAEKSSMLRTRNTGPWAWPGLPGRPVSREVKEVEEAKEAEETDSSGWAGDSCGVESKRTGARFADSACASGAEVDEGR
jgi:hypothetical protein